jgi:hypothetical protein
LGEPNGESTLPTALPRPRVKTKTKTSAASVVFNTFLVVSAVALTFVVLQREEDYAFARPADPAPAVEVQTDPPDMTGESMVLPPD